MVHCEKTRESEVMFLTVCFRSTVKMANERRGRDGVLYYILQHDTEFDLFALIIALIGASAVADPTTALRHRILGTPPRIRVVEMVYR